MNLFEKIVSAHGADISGKEVELSMKIDNTLTQDSTGTLAYLQYDSMGLGKVKTELSLSFVDHNTLQTGFENADDHVFLRSAADKFGIRFSRPGNGICHQVFLERFSKPGNTLIGSDSHTPTAGAMGMVAIGAGGLDVAVAMAGMPYYFARPKICLVKLSGELSPWVAGKDVILELLRLLTVKGGVGWVMEYGGEGVKSLSIPQRATITNMGAELGATTSIFPSDELTLDFLRRQGREKDYRALAADVDAQYDKVVEINLSALQPMIACPHSPDNVCPVSEVVGRKVDQVLIGSCTNSSYEDLMMVAAILRGKKIHQDVSLGIAPGSRQVLTMLARNGALADIVAAGARILEAACGPCIGMGQSPPNAGVSLRTFNRNFPGRTGTTTAEAYLCSPEIAAFSALQGTIADPRKMGEMPKIPLPVTFEGDDGMIVLPPADNVSNELQIGPNIKRLAKFEPLPKDLTGEVLLKAGDNISTDGIMPSHAKLLPFRSNIPYLAEHCLEPVDAEFSTRAKKAGGGIIVGGENWGQGSSREHAAIVPRFLGVTAVIVKSFARIHRANLINMGIVPLTFIDAGDYEKIAQGDKLVISEIAAAVRDGIEVVEAIVNGNMSIKLSMELTLRQQEMLLAGGLLNQATQIK
jgi:aconitate hydratase